MGSDLGADSGPDVLRNFLPVFVEEINSYRDKLVRQFYSFEDMKLF